MEKEHDVREYHAQTRAPYVYIQPMICEGCGVCVEVCPMEAIKMEDGKAVVIKEECRNCRICIRACPEGAIM